MKEEKDVLFHWGLDLWPFSKETLPSRSKLELRENGAPGRRNLEEV